jgi:hypothetical protein
MSVSTLQSFDDIGMRCVNMRHGVYRPLKDMGKLSYGGG